MTKDEAIKLVNDNLKFINKRVRYDGTTWIFVRFLIDQIEDQVYIVKAYLSQGESIDFTVTFDGPEDFVIL